MFPWFPWFLLTLSNPLAAIKEFTRSEDLIFYGPGPLGQHLGEPQPMHQEAA